MVVNYLADKAAATGYFGSSNCFDCLTRCRWRRCLLRYPVKHAAIVAGGKFVCISATDAGN